jgi:hypothetical protein
MTGRAHKVVGGVQWNIRETGQIVSGSRATTSSGFFFLAKILTSLQLDGELFISLLN